MLQVWYSPIFIKYGKGVSPKKMKLPNQEAATLSNSSKKRLKSLMIQFVPYITIFNFYFNNIKQQWKSMVNKKKNEEQKFSRVRFELYYLHAV